MGAPWLPRAEILSELTDKEWHNFSELLGKVGEMIQMEMATRVYMESGAVRVKGEDGVRRNISFDELQKRIPLSEIAHKGRRRAVQNTLNGMVKSGFIECKDSTKDLDFRDYKMLSKGFDWLGKLEKKKQRKDNPEPESEEEEGQKKPGPGRPKGSANKKKEPEPATLATLLSNLSVLAPELTDLIGDLNVLVRSARAVPSLPPEPALGPAPKLQFSVPKQIQGILEYIDLLEQVEIPNAFANIRQVLPLDDQRMIAASFRDIRRCLQYNVFAPTPIVQADPPPSLPPPAQTPAAIVTLPSHAEDSE